jgi:large subunit ribosomal protein L15
MRLKKRHKVSRMHGRGTHGWGARKKHMGSGHRGGVGMAGTGKKAGQKIMHIQKMYGTEYFGKSGITSRKTKREKNYVYNIGYIEANLETLKKKFGNKEGIIDLSDYKILGEGEITTKILVKARAVSSGAKEKIEKAGGKVIVPEFKEEKKIEEKSKEKTPETKITAKTKVVTKTKKEVKK